MEDIHDIKPLLNVDFPWFSFVALLLLFIGVLLLGAWLIRRWLSRPRKGAKTATKAEKPAARGNPREMALRALKALRPDPAHPGQFYLQLEKLLKEFLEAMHQQPITGYTSQQLVGFLQSRQTNDGIEPLLLHGQQAKFAAMPLKPEQMQQDLELAIGFVKKYSIS